MGSVEVKWRSHFNTKNRRHDEFFRQTLKFTRDNSQHTSTYPSWWDSFSICSSTFQSGLLCTNQWPCQMTFSPSAVMPCKAAHRLCTFDISTCSRWYYQCDWFQSAAAVELCTQPDCIHAAMSKSAFHYQDYMSVNSLHELADVHPTYGYACSHKATQQDQQYFPPQLPNHQHLP